MTSSNTVVPARASVPASRRATPGRKPVTVRRISANTVPYLLLAPAVVAILGLLGWPVVSVVIDSFQNLGPRQINLHLTEWVGVANYQEILSDPDFWTITGRTLAFTAGAVAAIMLGGLVTAHLMKNANRVVRVILQIALLLAWAMPIISATTVFQFLFDQNYGILNKTLVKLGFSGFAHHDWFSTSFSTLTIIIVLIAWEGIPFAAFTLYAGLLAVPSDLYEAASIDGATRWQAFVSVTWPGIRPIFMLTTFLEVLWDFKVFTQVWVFQRGGTNNSETLSVLQYLDGIAGNHYGVAAAVSVIMIVILTIITAQYIRMLVRSQEVRLS
ncbi:MAG TPA: sugar ABC transporter permease [Pseudonocardiaceae bacterium]|jgi:N,N'-diacetylchitobiose transport system permease protein|nr:sugar ABC transporter permease [Pseudonocardiaceae bacterium]